MPHYLDPNKEYIPLKKSADYVEPSAEFIADVEKQTQKDIWKVSRLCGISRAASKLLLSRTQLPRMYLDEAQRNFYHKEAGSLRVRMLNILQGPPDLRIPAMRRMRAIAEIVQNYRQLVKLNSKQGHYYLFPPRTIIKTMADAIDVCYQQFYRLHKECPEFDRFIFKDTPELLKELKKDIRVYVRKNPRRVSGPKLHKVPGDVDDSQGPAQESTGDSTGSVPAGQ